MRITQLSMLAMTTCLLFGFVHTAPAKAEDSVMTVEQVVVSETEFERYLDWKIHTAYGGLFSRDTITNALHDVIDRMFFMADACDRGFHRSKEAVKYDSAYRVISMVSEGKYLYDDIVTPNIVITEESLKDAYDKRQSIYHVTVLRFENEEEYLAAFRNKSFIHDSVSFWKYVEQLDTNAMATSVSVALQWPFTMFLDKQNLVYSMRPGTVTGPLHLPHGTFIVYLDRIEDAPSLPYEQQHKLLELLLTEHESSCLMAAYDTSIHQKAHSVVDQNAVDAFFGIYKAANDPAVIDKALFQDILDRKLATYMLEDRQHVVTIDDFIDYYQFLSQRTPLTSRDRCIGYIKECIFSTCAFADAQKRGLTRDPVYIAHCERHLHEYALSEYEKQFLEPLTEPSQQEIEQFYLSQVDSFTVGNEMVVSYCVFNDQTVAMKQYMKLASSLNIPEDVFLAAMTDSADETAIYRKQSITFKNTGVFSRKQVAQVFKMNNNTISPPIQCDDRYYLLYKHIETGIGTIPLDVMQDQIVGGLKQQKLVALKAKMLPELKKKYTLVNNIDYNKYLSEEWIANQSQ